MSSTPAYASTVNNGSALLAGAETDLQAPAQTSVILTAGASGSKIEEIVVQASKSGSLIATTVAGLVYLFLYDGATYHLFDTVAVTAITASTTVAPFRSSKVYNNLVLKTGWSLRASQSISGNASILKCEAFGGDY